MLFKANQCYPQRPSQRELQEQGTDEAARQKRGIRNILIPFSALTADMYPCLLLGKPARKWTGAGQGRVEKGPW